MIYAVAALLAFQLMGEVAVRALHLPLPGALAGMLLLFAALLWRGKVPAPLANTSRYDSLRTQTEAHHAS